MNQKIYITGTGRCGTTFLMLIFTFLDLDTGFTEDNFQNHISKSGCNSGLEKRFDDRYKIIKRPSIILDIEKIIKSGIRIEYVIIPIRDYQLSAKSRSKYKNNDGGFWNASNEEEQVLFYNKLMSDYLLTMVKYDIKTIFIDFERMVSDSNYLFDILNPILKDYDYIDFEKFNLAFTKSSIHQSHYPLET